MKHLRKFGSKADMETALANSTIGVIGLAYDGGNAVIKKVTPPPAPVTKYTLTVKLYSNEWSEVTWGTVSGNEGTFANGSVVTVTVTPIDGKEVKEWWVGDVVARNTNTCDIVVNGNTEVWVIMGDATIRHNLTVNVLPAEYAAYCSVSGAGIGVVLDGSSPTLTASSSSPYAIDHWEVDGVRVAGNASNYTLSPVHSDVTVDAYFTYFPQ